MKAFLNKAEVKKKYLTRVRMHAKADEIVKGKYWEAGKGCAVGCTVHSDQHLAYETEMGIPAWLAYVEDVIFEGLPNARAKKWPAEFLSAIKVGSDLNSVKSPFLIFVLESTLDKFDHVKFPAVKKSIDDVIGLHHQNMTDRKPKAAAWDAAGAAAGAAAWDAARAAAWAAAWDAAWAAAWDAARAAAGDAARAAAGDAARDAARAAAGAAAWDAARAAAGDAAWAAAWDAARAAARAAAYVKFADHLLRLLRGCK